jgi:Ca2+-binding EF-hand superfamily protein
MTIVQIEPLMEQFDRDNDGEIDFQVLLHCIHGERERPMKLMKAVMKKKQ